MGTAELNSATSQLIIHSVFFFYGDAAGNELSIQSAKDVASYWNEANGKVSIKGNSYSVRFDIEGIWAKHLSPEMIFENTNPRNNYFRIEEFALGNISFVDAINCNTGYFKLDNLLNNSTTAAHEYGHTIGLEHPDELDIRGKGVPGIMYPRGTIVDQMFQWDPNAAPFGPGGTMQPSTRKVLAEDIDNLKLQNLNFNNNGFAVLGEFSSIWHEKQIPQ
jgi:hypothetical protein